MTTSPPTADSPAQPTTGPLVIGPVRGFWSTRDLDSNPWAWVALIGPWVAALVVLSLEQPIDARLGHSAAAVVVVALVMAWFVIEAVLIFQSTAWGDAWWRVDDTGVSYTSPRRGPTFLAWDDVERIRLFGATTLRGRGVKVRFPPSLPQADLSEVARRIKEHLDEDFDLHPQPRPRPPRSIKDLIRLIATGIALMTAFFATTFGPLLVQDFDGPRIGWIGRLFGFGWIALFCAFFVAAFMQSEAERWISRRPAGHALKQGGA